MKVNFRKFQTAAEIDRKNKINTKQVGNGENLFDCMQIVVIWHVAKYCKQNTLQILHTQLMCTDEIQMMTYFDYAIKFKTI